MQYITDIKAQNEYQDCKLRYKIQRTGEYYEEWNDKNLKKMQEALDAVGIVLEVTNNELRLSINPIKYIEKRFRYAGRRKRYVRKDNGGFDFIHYADVVFMMQSMTDREIAAQIKMPIATYYRHKKVMKESYYYKSLDKSRLKDKEYLYSVKGNNGF